VAYTDGLAVLGFFYQVQYNAGEFPLIIVLDFPCVTCV
jgi:hypothetical protein